jgi:hypothetical protein
MTIVQPKEPHIPNLAPDVTGWVGGNLSQFVSRATFGCIGLEHYY